MKPIPIYITTRDYGSAAVAMVRRLQQIPLARPIIVDNASTWPPWLEWLDRAPCEVIRNTENLGPRAGLARMEETAGDAEFYVITDADLDIDQAPLDVLDVLRSALDQFPAIGKVGLSIEIEDIPESYANRRLVVDNENPYWVELVKHAGRRYWRSLIDCTFAMLRRGEPYTAYGPALRVDRPYTARHLPWYITPANETPEYRYFLEHCPRNHIGGANWTALALAERGLL